MELQLGDHVAVVVGGANGIGAAIANGLAAEGCRVVLVDRDPATPERARQLAQRHGGLAWGYVVDVGDWDATRSVARRVEESCGRCRHLVFAVGMGSGKYGFPFWDLDPSDWPRVLEVNLLGAVHVTHAFVAQLRAAAPGGLLFLSSTAGQIGSQTDPPYSAAKAALINFAQCAAKDLAADQVRVNTICPGMIQTDLNRSVWQAWANKQPEGERVDYETWASEKIHRVTPLGRWQTPEDVAALALFLLSPRAANITGQTMNVDGGQIMHS
jgi:2-hydroxycyclohexanecarboxyl-CoA dehydrogenase